MDIYTTFTVEVTGRCSTAAVIEDASGTSTIRVRATSKRTAIEQVLRRAADGLRVFLRGEPIVFDDIVRITARKGTR